MDCFNHSCPFRVNETSNANRCECVACQNRSNSDFIITSNRTLTDDELAMLTALEMVPGMRSHDGFGWLSDA